MYIKQYIYNITFKQIPPVSLVLGNWTTCQANDRPRFSYLRGEEGGLWETGEERERTWCIPELLQVSTISRLPT